jgi:light-regulated signal transduction histidine kinase (bacteriophytochrome)
MEIGLSPVTTDKGTWVLGEILDVTERQRAEREISRMNLELEERVIERTAELTAANAELESFSYSVSHDLRAPLRQISGFSKILVETYGPDLNPEARRYLQKVQDGAHYMGSLIDDLLNLAKVGRQPLSRRPTPLQRLVETALEILKPEWTGREIEWQIDPLRTAECDPGLLQQVFINILSNAIKYTRIRDRAMIQVGQTTVNGEPVVFVRDNGAGFDMSYAGKLFGVFQRLHNTRDFDGAGVGLATCQRIVHKHGGRIWAEAEPDKGATFFFTIHNDPGSKRERISGNGR